MRSALLVLLLGAVACAPSNVDALLSADADGDATPTATAQTPAPTRSGQEWGARGIGDPDFPLDGNGGYDVSRYRLKMGYDPATKHLTGNVSIEAKATQSLRRFNLDLKGFDVGKVSVAGKPATFTRSGDELSVTPAAPLAKGGPFTVTVTYEGVPQPVKDSSNLGTYGFIPTADGAYVVCQPNGAKTWFPSNDHPADKARFDFELTVPEGLTALANGELTKKPVTSGGKTTFTWSERHPMVTYLATMTLGKFELREGRTAKGVPNLAAVDPKYRSTLDNLHTVTGEITDYWSTVFGPYPFSSTGGVVDDFAAGYALENQTKPMYGGFKPDESIIAHELAHQWYGDSLSIRRWEDLWLNEGFATYAEWLWSEHRGGTSAQSLFDSYYAKPAGNPMWAYPPGDAKPNDLFNDSVYTRGAMTLHALRTAVGDTAFFALLKKWAQDHKYGHVTTPQFVALAEKTSGKQLDQLFDAWLFKKGKPAL
ncbi:M1 family metallopeptidase [Nonomuraea dietziae]|uniref:M1 family metallopeptidase n=1 Tax=Nonomuraea dietziae TaxID=65515 RepID=UPI0033EC4AC0